jgi:hypothetical protein
MHAAFAASVACVSGMTRAAFSCVVCRNAARAQALIRTPSLQDEFKT